MHLVIYVLLDYADIFIPKKGGEASKCTAHVDAPPCVDVHVFVCVRG